MFSRKCALDVTPLDEKPFLYEEELILGISMEKAGWKTVMTKECSPSSSWKQYGKSEGICLYL